MKKLSLLIFLIYFVNNSFAQLPNKIELPETKIKHITVFLSGAEINRQADISLQKGENLIVFSHLSPQLDNKSVRVSINQNVDILSISSKKDFLNKQTDQPRIKQLKDSLLQSRNKIIALSDDMEAYKLEKKLLIDNMQLSGKQTGVSVSELQQATTFYRNKLKEINPILSKFKKDLENEQVLQKRLQLSLQELNADELYERRDVFILVKSDKAQKVPVDLQYIVHNAGWAPSYDVKATDLSQKIQLMYRAKVFNNTRIDWSNVNLVLSLSDPTKSDSKPILTPWYLNNSNNQNMIRDINQSIGYIQNMLQTQTNNYYGGEKLILDTDEYTEVVVNEFNTDFEIVEKYSIPADDKPYLVDVASYELEADYKHYAVTKLDKDVFLLARITGWQDLNLIEGPANVYFKGSFVGKSKIQTRNVKDTLDISLGRDNKVLVTRSKLKNYSSTQFIGSKIKQVFAYQLVAKNNRKNEIEIEILDQIPVSQTDEIEVKILETSAATLNAETGKLSWKYTLKPGEKKEIILSFEIKYPKDKQINFEHSKAKMMRKF